MPEIGEGIYHIPGQDEFIPDAHVYVLGKPGGGDLTLVDAGLMGKAGYKLQALEEAGLPAQEFRRVIMTHTHLDHVGCLPEILAAMPAAELWVHETEAEPLEQGDERTVYGMEMFRTMCQAQYGIEPGRFKLPVQRRLHGGETLDLGGMRWEIHLVHGHSPGSIALYQPEQKTLIPGDTIYADQAIGRYDLHGASGPDLLDSLMKLSELAVQVLLPGHNRIVKNLPSGYIQDTARQWAGYLT